MKFISSVLSVATSASFIAVATSEVHAVDAHLVHNEHLGSLTGDSNNAVRFNLRRGSRNLLESRTRASSLRIRILEPEEEEESESEDESQSQSESESASESESEDESENRSTGEEGNLDELVQVDMENNLEESVEINLLQFDSITPNITTTNASDISESNDESEDDGESLSESESEDESQSESEDEDEIQSTDEEGNITNLVQVDRENYLDGSAEISLLQFDDGTTNMTTNTSDITDSFDESESEGDNESESEGEGISPSESEDGDGEESDSEDVGESHGKSEDEDQDDQNEERAFDTLVQVISEERNRTDSDRINTLEFHRTIANITANVTTSTSDISGSSDEPEEEDGDESESEDEDENLSEIEDKSQYSSDEEVNEDGLAQVDEGVDLLQINLLDYQSGSTGKSCTWLSSAFIGIVLVGIVHLI